MKLRMLSVAAVAGGAASVSDVIELVRATVNGQGGVINVNLNLAGSRTARCLLTLDDPTGLERINLLNFASGIRGT